MTSNGDLLITYPLWTRVSLIGTGFAPAFPTPWHQGGRVDTLHKSPVQSDVDYYLEKLAAGMELAVGAGEASAIVHDAEHRTIYGVYRLGNGEVRTTTLEEFHDQWDFTAQDFLTYTKVAVSDSS